MKSIFLSIFIFFISFSISGQDFDLLGIVDDQLIKINAATNAIEVVGDLNPSPSELVRFLTFVEEDCLFYGIMNSSVNPTLVSIDLDLNFSVIADLILPGGSLYFCEGLSFNNSDNTLYASVSLNGSIASGDYHSETIVEVNRFIGVCQFKTEIIGNVAFPDIDRMAFCDNVLYFYDGQPGDNWGKFFELDFSNLGATAQALELTTVGYIPVKDLECLNGNVYFSTGRDLSFLNTTNSNITNLGNLFTPGDFGGEEITGLGINPFPDYIDFPVDIVLCEGESYTIKLEGVGQNVSWNNGYTGNELIITESGLYWAVVSLDECEFLTDTVNVSIIEQINQELVSDTVICSGETIYFTINEPELEVVWNDGSLGAEIAISEGGYYWAQYIKEGCMFFTDTIFVEVVDEEFNIGPDINLCEGETYTLNLTGVGQNITWSNGEVGNQIEISDAGGYWAEISLNNCQIITNSITVDIVPLEKIEIGSDTVLCGIDEISLSVLDPISNYQWNTGEIDESIVVQEDGIYWATALNNECPSYSDSIEVRFIEDPQITYNIDTILCVDEILDINPSIFDIEWQNEAGEILSIITESGNYLGTYQLDQCLFETDILRVKFIDCTPCEYFIPNIISPNFDGVNDEFEVTFTNSCRVLDFEISIFDRWGNLVHYSKENYWDGVFNEKPVANGVYIYLIKMSFSSPFGVVQDLIISGDITIVK